jgi:hypothetical protein
MASLADLIHGQKPQIAPFEPTDPIAELQKLLLGESQDWPQIAGLSDMYQTYMTDAFNKLFDFSDITKQGGIDTDALLKAAQPLIMGDIPKDTAAQVLRSSAARGLSSGLLGSPAGQSIDPLQLGLTSLDLKQMGAGLVGAGTNAAQRWQQIAQGAMLPPSANLYSPEWFTQFIAQQNAARQATKQERYNVAAAPDPAISGIAGTIMNLVGAYLGHGMGGGGGGIIPNTQVQGNTGFLSNFSNASQGGAPTGLGGFLGNLWGGATGSNTYGPSAGDMSTLGANYGAAGLPVTYGESGFPSAIPVAGVDYGQGYGTGFYQGGQQGSYDTTPYQYNIAQNPFNQ